MVEIYYKLSFKLTLSQYINKINLINNVRFT
jgi:hypothetical protein